MSIVLGPVHCQGCNRLVYWDGWSWREARANFPYRKDFQHDCWGRRVTSLKSKEPRT